MMQTTWAMGFVAGVVALATTASPARAWEQVQLGQVYILHTAQVGTCPALDWHFVVDAHRSIAGFLVCDQTTTRTAVLSGNLDADDSFQMSVTEPGGSRSAKVAGRFTSRAISLSVDGPSTPCDQQQFRIGVVRGFGLGGGGG